MITLTRLNDIPFTLNDDLIEVMEERPDTTIKLQSGTTYIVKESIEEIEYKIVQFKRRIFSDMLRSVK